MKLDYNISRAYFTNTSQHSVWPYVYPASPLQSEHVPTATKEVALSVQSVSDDSRVLGSLYIFLYFC